jgi:hypothetical protein
MIYNCDFIPKVYERKKGSKGAKQGKGAGGFFFGFGVCLFYFGFVTSYRL